MVPRRLLTILSALAVLTSCAADERTQLVLVTTTGVGNAGLGPPDDPAKARGVSPLDEALAPLAASAPEHSHPGPLEARRSAG